MRLDRRIIIESFTQAQDTMGHSAKTWSTFYECWASKMDKSGSEGLENARDTATRLTIWKIRHNPDYLPLEKMRVNYESRYYDIEVVKELGRKEGYELTTISKDGNG